MKNRFYLACFRDNVGSNVAFHGINGNGYPTGTDKAQTYTIEEAQKAWNNARVYDQPISADHVDAMTIFKVDMQYLPITTTLDKKGNEYVAFFKGRYDGNDVSFITENNGVSFDFSKAKVFTLDEVNDDDKLTFISLTLADSKKRPTFDMRKLNRRTMIQGAGLKVPDHVKKYKRRKANPKTRWNCPGCGKLSWQGNPYDFEGCSDYNCIENTIYK